MTTQAHFDSEDIFIFSPTDYKFPDNDYNTVEDIYYGLLGAILDLECVNSLSAPPTGADRESRLADLSIRYPMPSDDIPVEERWWTSLPAYDDSNPPRQSIGYSCDSMDEKSPCTVGLCEHYQHENPPFLPDNIEYKTETTFAEILASFGMEVDFSMTSKMSQSTIQWDEDWIDRLH